MEVKYLVLANQFSFKKSGDCLGRAIASSDAIYLVPGAHDLEVQDSPGVRPILGGAAGLGAAIASSDVKRILKKFKDRFAQELVDLQALVSEESDWPIRKDVQGIILRREDVSRMRYPWWGALLVQLGDRKAVIKPFFTRRSRVLAFLRESGWMI